MALLAEDWGELLSLLCADCARKVKLAIADESDVEFCDTCADVMGDLNDLAGGVADDPPEDS